MSITAEPLSPEPEPLVSPTTGAPPRAHGAPPCQAFPRARKRSSSKSIATPAPGSFPERPPRQPGSLAHLVVAQRINAPIAIRHDIRAQPLGIFETPARRFAQLALGDDRVQLAWITRRQSLPRARAQRQRAKRDLNFLHCPTP